MFAPVQEPSEQPVSVCLLAFPETTPAALYGLYEVFAAVGASWPELGEAGLPGRRTMRTTIVTRDGGPFVTTRGIPLPPTTAMAEVESTDIAIVSDLDLASMPGQQLSWAAEGAWLRRQLEHGATIASVCTGSVLLAEAGLLDGVDATTHWGAAGLFAQRYPSVRLRPERILCTAGPEDRIVTSGGSASWVDLVLYLIARYCGPTEAMLISKVFVLGDHSDGQLPFAMMTRRRSHEDAVVGRCQAWIAEHYAVPNPVTRMVELSGLTERTFKRRFKAATGLAPVDYVLTLRVEEAKQMLETTDLPTDEIAEAVGYRDPASFRRVFKRRAGVTPARYRQRFRSIPGVAAVARPRGASRAPA